MTDHLLRDAEIERAIEALARRNPPAGHVARVLAASGPAALDERPPASPYDTGGGGWLRPRWVLPVAASVTVAIGAWWQAVPAAPSWPAPDAATSPAPAWKRAREIERPVLPPQMYWAMDPFAEFATLRPSPGRLAVPKTATADRMPAFGSAMPAATGVSQVVAQAIDDEYLPSGGPAATSLPEITLASIMPVPVVMPPLPRPAAIQLAEIAMAPITLAPIDTHTLPEENP